MSTWIQQMGNTGHTNVIGLENVNLSAFKCVWCWAPFPCASDFCAGASCLGGAVLRLDFIQEVFLCIFEKENSGIVISIIRRNKCLHENRTITETVPNNGPIVYFKN